MSHLSADSRAILHGGQITNSRHPLSGECRFHRIKGRSVIAMVRIPHRRRERPLIRLGEQDREIVAAWFVVLLAVAAGVSFVSIQRYATSDCSTTLAMPRVLHRPPAVTEDWENLTCSSGRCSYMGPVANFSRPVCEL